MNWTDDFSFYLNAVSEEVARLADSASEGTLARTIDIHREGHWPDLEGIQMVIIGIEEEQGKSSPEKLCDADCIRLQLYQLFAHAPHQKVADLGNIKPGDTRQDMSIAIQKVVGGLALRQTMAVLIGGRQDLTYSNYAAYEALESTVNVAVVDSLIDMGEFRDHLSETNFLSKIVTHKPSYLFNLAVLGYQTYLNDPENLLLMDRLYFDAVRLGDIRHDMRLVEPHLRQADLVSIDLGSARNADLPGTGQPNGFTGEELCRIARYAGISDSCSSLGIYNYSAEADTAYQGARLVAQMIWHAMQGLSNRIKEHPLMSKPAFFEYKVQLSERSEHITFFKSKKTEKWWMNVPFETGVETRQNRHHLVPCNYTDYETAAKGEIPDLWWRTYRKLV